MDREISAEMLGKLRSDQMSRWRQQHRRSFANAKEMLEIWASPSAQRTGHFAARVRRDARSVRDAALDG